MSNKESVYAAHPLIVNEHKKCYYFSIPNQHPQFTSISKCLPHRTNKIHSISGSDLTGVDFDISTISTAQSEDIPNTFHVSNT